MKKIVLTFGLIAGAIVSSMIALMPYCLSGQVDFDGMEVVGYSSMILAFLLVFFGIRSYRDNVNGGTITFGKAFRVGILITLVACTMYVVTWEIVYNNFMPDFLDRLSAHTMKKMQEDGESAAAIAAAQKQMQDMKGWYANPLLRILVTYLEIFPVGLIMTLISAAILKRRSGATPVPAMA